MANKRINKENSSPIMPNPIELKNTNFEDEKLKII